MISTNDANRNDIPLEMEETQFFWVLNFSGFNKLNFNWEIQYKIAQLKEWLQLLITVNVT